LRVILEGSLRHFPASELLGLLAENKHTGTLDAKEGDGEARARLAFRDGRVAWAEATGASDLPAVVALLVRWEDGEFWFLDDAAVPDGVTPLTIDVLPLVEAARQRAAEEQRLLKLYPDEEMAFRVTNRPQGDVSLKAEEFQVLFQIGTGKTLAQLLADSKRPRVELYTIVARLQAAKLVEPIAAVEATAKTMPGKPVTAAKQSAPIGTLTADDGTMYPLLEDVTTIGRTPSNAVALPDGSVSSNHARVLRSADGFLIEDVGSRNGTYVNSERVSGKRALLDGDVLRLGKVLLTFNVAVETKKQSTTTPELKSS
jgi:pSer/pThr/pTyr-binding forkhead associated (FHA) protein